MILPNCSAIFRLDYTGEEVERKMAAARKKRGAAAADDRREVILETALELAEDLGWQRVTMREIATRLDLPLSEIQAHYRDLDALADAWFAKAWQAMLAVPWEELAGLDMAERLETTMMAWFDSLARHRRVSCQMLREKLYPAHPHHWVPMVFNLSRSIQLLRDATKMTAEGRQRQLEEIALSGLFLSSLSVWSRDSTAGQTRTRAYLKRRLKIADRIMTVGFKRSAVSNT